MSSLANKHFLVLGLGKTGVSAVRFLMRQGVRVTVADSRAQPPGLAQLSADYPQVTVHTDGFSTALLDDVDELLVSPGIDLREPVLNAARARGLPMHGDIEWFARNAQAPVVAITGSNGKSTVTAMVAEMARRAGLQVAVGGNFGTPALDLLADDVTLYVLELSSFQLELTQSLAPRAACVLNVSADHIDRHGDMAHYAALKASIFRHAEVAVLNRDDVRVRQMNTGAAEVLSFGDAAPAGADEFGLCEIDGALVLVRGDETLMPVSETRLRGRHNYLNALAALALGQAAGLPLAAMRQALSQFAGLPHRCQWVANIAGVDWVNDSKGTNVGALLASLEGLPAPIVLLAGGQAKGGDFAPVGPVLARKGRLALLFGADAAIIDRAIGAYVPVRHVPTLAAAVTEAARAAQPGDTVLLSPGCASLDMFTDYQDRGEQFTAAVLELAA